MEWLDVFLRGTLLSLHFIMWLKSQHKGTKLEAIMEDVRDLDKVPLHLAVVVQEEEVSCDDLAQMTAWAFAGGVKMVSLYDPCGKILRDKVLLQTRLHHHHRKFFSPPLPDVEVSDTSSSVSPHQLPQHRDDPYKVMILRQEDGYHNIAETVAGVCEFVQEGRLGVDQIDASFVSKRIAKFPDPELVVVFGRLCSMVGFPPWQLRLTEIHLLPTHHKVSYQHFLEILQKYSSCRQRHGK